MALRGVEERFWAKVLRLGPNECWPWLGAKEVHGYGKLFSHRDEAGRSQFHKAHRLSWQLANAEAIPDGMIVLHSCDNPPCVNASHLRLGTDADNAADRAARGRGADQRGALAGGAKLTEAEVRAILIELQRLPRRSQSAIAAEFGIKQAQVSRIMRRVCWSHLWCG